MGGTEPRVYCSNQSSCLERLGALTPRPRINLILYHGVLAPRAAWWSLVVQFGTAVSPDQNARPDDAQDQDPGAADRPDGSNQHWADLMRRVVEEVVVVGDLRGQVSAASRATSMSSISRCCGAMGVARSLRSRIGLAAWPKLFA